MFFLVLTVGCHGCYMSTPLPAPGDGAVETVHDGPDDQPTDEMQDISHDPVADPLTDDVYEMLPDPHDIPFDALDEDLLDFADEDLPDLPDADTFAPILYYPFDGDVQNYGLVSGHHGTWAGGPEYLEGKFGMAVKFDIESRNHIIFDNTREPLSAYAGYTIGLWFKEDSAEPFVALIDSRAFAGGFQTYHGVRGEQRLTTCYTMGPYDDTCTGAVADYSGPDGQWHHVLFREDGAEFRIYVDGVLKWSEPIDGRVFSSRQQENLILGRNYRGDRMYSNFYVDELKIYGRVFSEQDQCTIAIDGTWDGDRCILP